MTYPPGSPYEPPPEQPYQPYSNPTSGYPLPPDQTQMAPGSQPYFPYGVPASQPYPAPTGQPYIMPPGQPYMAPMGQPFMMVAPYSAAPPASGMAIASFVLGLIGLLFIWLYGLGVLLTIPGVILGHVAQNQIHNSRGAIGGGGFAVAGLVLGYITIGLAALCIAAIVIIGSSLRFSGLPFPTPTPTPFGF